MTFVTDISLTADAALAAFDGLDLGWIRLKLADPEEGSGCTAAELDLGRRSWTPTPRRSSATAARWRAAGGHVDLRRCRALHAHGLQADEVSIAETIRPFATR